MQSLYHYYPGGNTPEGFFSYYHDILDRRRVKKLAVIKGGPGTGKSTFLKKLGATLQSKGEPITFLHCSSDPDSLDGIYLARHNSAVIDGTAPHMTDAKYLGAYDTVFNFCDFIGDISDKETVLTESQMASATFSEGYCYLRSAGALLDLMHQRSEQVLLEDEIRSFAMDMTKRISAFSANGFCQTAFLSAITADGFRNFLDENLKDYYVIAIDSEVGDSSNRLMETVKTACCLRNIDVITCPCPMNPQKAEHLIFPSANFALVTSNVYHPYAKADEMIPFTDFMKHRVPNRAPQMMYDGVLRLATQTFSQAREHHNRLEAVYKTVTDYASIESLYQKALNFLVS